MIYSKIIPMHNSAWGIDNVTYDLLFYQAV